MKTDKFSRFKTNNNPILLRSYLNLISVIACSKTVHPWFGLLHTIHHFIIFCKIVKTGTTYAESSFLVGLRLRDFEKSGLRLRTPDNWSKAVCVSVLYMCVCVLTRICSPDRNHYM